MLEPSIVASLRILTNPMRSAVASTSSARMKGLEGGGVGNTVADWLACARVLGLMGVLSVSLGSSSDISVDSLEANEEKLSREGVVTEETTDGDGDGSLGVLRVKPEENDGAADGSRSWVPGKNQRLEHEIRSADGDPLTCLTPHGRHTATPRSCTRNASNARSPPYSQSLARRVLIDLFILFRRDIFLSPARPATSAGFGIIIILALPSAGTA
jgi:hypothetical protein